MPGHEEQAGPLSQTCGSRVRFDPCWSSTIQSPPLWSLGQTLPSSSMGQGLGMVSWCWGWGCHHHHHQVSSVPRDPTTPWNSAFIHPCPSKLAQQVFLPQFPQGSTGFPPPLIWTPVLLGDTMGYSPTQRHCPSSSLFIFHSIHGQVFTGVAWPQGTGRLGYPCIAQPSLTAQIGAEASPLPHKACQPYALMHSCPAAVWAPHPCSCPRFHTPPSPCYLAGGGQQASVSAVNTFAEFWFFTCHCLDVGQCIFRASFDEPLCCLQCVVLEIKLQLSVVLFLTSAGTLEGFPEIRLTVKSLMYLQCRCTCPTVHQFSPRVPVP